MFFAIREIKGNAYLIKLTSFRNKAGKPRNKPEYIGSLAKVEHAIKRWKNANNRNKTKMG